MEEVLNSLDEQLQGIVGADSQPSKLIWFHLKYNHTHPEYARILFMKCRLSKDFCTTPSYQLVHKYAGVLSNILQKGLHDGIFRSDLDVGLVRDIILGTLTYEIVTCIALKEIKVS
jgi:TetR/AcrR family fatty acid metabolism transcriptional regulator